MLIKIETNSSLTFDSSPFHLPKILASDFEIAVHVMIDAREESSRCSSFTKRKKKAAAARFPECASVVNIFNERECDKKTSLYIVIRHKGYCSTTLKGSCNCSKQRWLWINHETFRSTSLQSNEFCAIFRNIWDLMRIQTACSGLNNLLTLFWFTRCESHFSK